MTSRRGSTTSLETVDRRVFTRERASEQCWLREAAEPRSWAIGVSDSSQTREQAANRPVYPDAPQFRRSEASFKERPSWTHLSGNDSPNSKLMAEQHDPTLPNRSESTPLSAGLPCWNVTNARAHRSWRGCRRASERHSDLAAALEPKGVDSLEAQTIIGLFSGSFMNPIVGRFGDSASTPLDTATSCAPAHFDSTGVQREATGKGKSRGLIEDRRKGLDGDMAGLRTAVVVTASSFLLGAAFTHWYARHTDTKAPSCANVVPFCACVKVRRPSNALVPTDRATRNLPFPLLLLRPLPDFTSMARQKSVWCCGGGGSWVVQ